MEKSNFIEQSSFLINTMCQALVDNPADLKVDTIIGEQTIQFVIGCGKTDVGQVLGKQGRNIQAIRSIITAFAGKHKYRTVICFDESLSRNYDKQT